MATSSDQLPPWETAASEGPPPWEAAEAPTTEVPPWEEAGGNVQGMEVSGASPQPPSMAQAPAIDPGALDTPAQIDKSNSFLSSWVNSLGENAWRMGPEGMRHNLDQTARGFGQTILGLFKAPGQAIKSVEDLAGVQVPSYVPVMGTYVKAAEWIDKFQREFIDDPRKEIPFEDQLSQGAGSALAFMGTGSLLNAAGFSPALASAATGGAVGASQQYDDALSKGATPEQAGLAYLGGGAFGTTEAIPGALFIKKLNAITGGKMLNTLKTYNQSLEHSTPWEAVKGGVEEAVQEGVQQIGQNWVASDLAAYDPSRPLGENFWQNVATGGIIGSMLGGGINMMRNAEKGRILQEMEANRQLLLQDPINDIGGTFTPLGDYAKLNQLASNAAQELEDRMTQADANYTARGNDERVDLAGMAPEAQDPRFIGYEHSTAQAPIENALYNSPVNAGTERILPEKADKSPHTALEAFETTPVVALDDNPYKEMLSYGIQALAKAVALGETQKIKVLTKSVEELKKKSAIADKIVDHVKAYAAVFRQVLGPDTKVLITSNYPGSLPPKTNGLIQVLKNVPLPNGTKAHIASIFVDLDSLSTEVFNNKNMKVSDATYQMRRRLFETINHELGHMVAANAVSNIYDTIVSPTSTPQQVEGASRLLTLMKEEYRNWLEKAAGEKTSFLFRTQFALERAQDAMTQVGLDRLIEPMSASTLNKTYLLSFDEFFAEMTARLATQGALADPIMTRYFSSVIPQYQQLFQKLPRFAQSEYGNDWKAYLQKNTTAWKVKEELEKVQAGGSGDIIKALRNGIPGLDPEKFAGLQQHLDRFDKLISYGFNLIQLAKENPHIEGLQSYLKSMAAWAEYQRNFQADANEVYKSWRNLGKLEAAQLSAVLFDEALSRKMTDPVQLTRLLSAEAQSVYKQVREQLAKVLEEMRQTTLQDLHRSILDNEELLNAEVAQINEDFDKMLQQGYFPFIRFGKYTITARAKEPLTYNGNSYKKGELISFPAFESEKERDEVLRDIRTQLGVQANVASSVMRETDFVIQGMPRSVLRALRNKLEASGNFTVEQAKAFEAAAAESAPFRNFQKHMLKKKGIHGYSEDALRSFAAYIRGAAGHISRVRFNDDIRSSIDLVQQSTEVIKELGGRADERQEIRHWMDRHFSYVMNPGNELAVLRGVGFVHYLGFNLKSAMVNLTQLLTTVAPYLAARYGDTQALSHLSKATWTLQDWVLKRKSYTDAMGKLDTGTANASETSKALLGRMIARGIHEGWLDQSLATELAIAASENNLDRGLYLSTGRRWWHNVSRWSALPFHLVEKLNRYITAISTFNLEMQSSGSYEKSVLAAREANWSANYENARWNRPEFMRGKKSAFFLFGNYLQNTLYFATRDPGAVRYWLMMLILAGAMGLPGADNVADLADFAATYLNRLLGIKNPKTQLRVELREHLEELGANPDLILHGLSQDSFGLGHVGELTGIPVPHLDLSRSVGMGDIVPGTAIPGMMLQSEPNDILVAAATEMAGAGGSLVQEYYKSALSTDPDAWKRAEKLLPLVAARNASKAARMALRGAETTQSGNVIAEFDPYDPRNAMELAAQALGFQPAELTLGWERQIAVQDNIQYYKVQQEMLLKQMNYARFQQDREAVADMLESVRRYNQQVPKPEMSITVETMKDSFKSYLEKRVVSGMGLEAERKYRRLREQTEQAYPNPMGTKDNRPENP